MQHGLAKIDSPQGVIVAYATQAGRTAEDGSGRNSPYTTAFLKHIQEEEEIGTVFRRIAADVYDATRQAQLPELSLSLIGESYLHGRPSNLQSVQTDPCGGAEAHWKSAETIGTPAGYEDHLSRFSNCAFAGLARAKLAASPPPAEPAIRMPSTNAVDPAGVGTWETMVPNNRGLARWVWEILPGGTYRFHSEGPGAVRSHEGTMTLNEGRWTLHATRGLPGYDDAGPYEFHDANTLIMTGRLGPGIWRRVGTAVGERPHGPSRSGGSQR
jgi:hypothetical protein